MLDAKMKTKRLSMNQKLSSNHTTIQKRHPRSLVDIMEIRSEPQPFILIPKPTRRYLKQLALSYIYCPDCESKNITYYGKSSAGTQKYRCKECGYQFVGQLDAYFPQSTRRDTFEKEFMGNLQRQGFKEGVGRREYWEGALQITLNMLESQTMSVKMNKMIKQHPIQNERDYQLLLQYAVHEAYVRATN